MSKEAEKVLITLAVLVVPQVALWTAVFAYAATQDTEVARVFLPVFFAPVSAALLVGCWELAKKQQRRAGTAANKK